MSELPDGPWADLDPSGATLSVDDFVTTMISRTGSGLRRAITQAYAQAVDLSISEWRMLSVLAHARQLSFGDLVVQSAADKAQVSRALKLLGQRGLVRTESDGLRPRGRVTCFITDAGLAIYEQVMPQARARQAAMLLALDREQRRVLYQALTILRERCIAELGELPPGDA